jgi:triosephosphate isomerase (TIM)
MAVIAGNWKMHHGPQATRAFFADLTLEGVGDEHEVLVFPPAIALQAAVAASEASGGRVGVGVQNVYWEDEGAFTGETSARMAKEAGATFALVGHSERRHVFGESDDDVRRKVEATLRHGLVPVVCVGETLEERRAGRVDEVISRQLRAALPALAHEGARFLLAYEPVWAIGTGETATPRDASAAHATLRACLEDGVGVAGAPKVAILYGGSVKPDNAAELLGAPEVDGVLVGGASLDPRSFAAIAAAR